jgi:hypothetical protein
MSLVKGDQWVRTLRFRQGTAEGDPVDLTGSTLTAAIYDTPGGTKQADVSLTVVSPATAGDAVIDITEAVSGTLSAEQFSQDPSGTHWLVVKMVDSLSVTRTMLQVKMRVTPGQ